MAEIVQKRLLKMIDYICTMRYPFENRIVERIAVLRKEEMNANSWNEMGALLLQLLIGVEKYFFAAYDEMSVLSNFCDYVTQDADLKKKYVRYVKYAELSKKGVKDKDIFSLIYEEEKPPCPLETFQGSMRQWKRNHSYLFEMNDNFTIHKNKLEDYTLPIDSDHDVTYFIENPSGMGKTSQEKLKEIWGSMRKATGEDKYLYLYHFFIQAVVRIIDSTRDGCVIYDNYVFLLNKIGLLIFLKNSTQAKELSYIAEGNIMKAPCRPSSKTTKADVQRALATIKTPPNVTDRFESITNTYRRKYKQLQREQADAVSEQGIEDTESEVIIMQHFIEDFLSAKQGKRYKSRVKTWNDILEMQQSYGYAPNSANIRLLKGIFDVCREKRKWRIPEESDLKNRFEDLEYRYFFHDLYHRLDKTAHIEEIANIRWHKKKDCEHVMTTLQDSLNSPEIYTPYRGK